MAELREAEEELAAEKKKCLAAEAKTAEMMDIMDDMQVAATRIIATARGQKEIPLKGRLQKALIAPDPTNPEAPRTVAAGLWREMWVGAIRSQ